MPEKKPSIKIYRLTWLEYNLFFDSYQQASGLILAGYLTTLLGRTDHANWLVSWHGSSI